MQRHRRAGDDGEEKAHGGKIKSTARNQPVAVRGPKMPMGTISRVPRNNTLKGAFSRALAGEIVDDMATGEHGDDARQHDAKPED